MTTPQGDEQPRATPPAGTGRIVAELGRPETPEETAARKAENSRAHRANQTTRNLILALIASVAIVLFTVLVVPRPDQTKTKYVDYRAVASQAQQSVTEKLASPKLPAGWLANRAQLNQGSGTSETWSIGFVTPKTQFIGLEQGIHVTDAWFGSQLGKEQPSKTIVINGVRWTVYDQRTASDPGNYAYALAVTAGKIRYLLHGSASDAEFATLATALNADLGLVKTQTTK